MSDPEKSKFSGPDLCRMEAHEIVSLLRKKDVSPAELVELSLARIHATDDKVNATPILCPERAREAASQTEVGAQDHPGWLAGLPIAIKDLSPIAGVRSTFGTKALADYVPDITAPVVSLLERHGGVIVGKTNTPEFGAGGNTFNDVFGPTLNAWDTSLNAGGSSGGAAVSLATGQIWLSHGSDHGGSLRTPAAYNGIVGLRPSPGRVPGKGDAGFLLEGLEGPMARSVRDCALFLDAMAGFEPQSPTSFATEGVSFGSAVERASPGIRVAFSPDLGGFAPVEPDMRRYLAKAMTLLERNGAHVEEVAPKIDNLERTYHVLRGFMWATVFRPVPDEITRHFKQTLRENIAFGNALTIDDMALAHLHRTTIYNNMQKLFASFDVLACPVVGNMPRAQTEEWVRQVDGVSLSGYMDWLKFAFLSTVTGLPSVSVPAGFSDDGLPVGLQLIGKPRGEAALLAAARAVEMAVGGPVAPIDPMMA